MDFFLELSMSDGRVRILAVCGSLRGGSWNKKLLREGAEFCRAAGAVVTELDLREYSLPIYDAEIQEHSFPENGVRLKKIFSEHNGLLLASPEYNGSYSGALKNTIDWVSRATPGEKGANLSFKGMVGAMMTTSPGALGGFRGLVPLRMLLQAIGVLVLTEQVAIPGAAEAFGPDGKLVDNKRRETVEALVRKLIDTITKLG
jgi:chromate reductase, NAD(P)H dehydrogenase (quinone)